ncbi:phage tail protein, partial [Sodalis praecaptivus]|uniref:phage tail protein n=1 Tax=Sodalis praecaptivus TaxID=1239307 RepID=UPI00280C3022
KANVAVIFPAWQKSWTVVNQCTGSGSLICRTKAGTGVVVPNGESREIIGDGSGLVQRIVNASITVAGITQLSSATDSDSETLAATPRAVKAAMDLAASSAVKSVNGKKGEVKLTAADVGALSLQGGTVNGSLKVERGINTSGNVEAWDLKANGGVYDQGQRVYSSKNPPTSANLSQNGWYKDNTTGFIYQWGYIGSTNVTQNFPIAFPRSCFNFIVSNSNAQGKFIDTAFGYPVNNSSFYVATKDVEGHISNYPAYWSAIGF